MLPRFRFYNIKLRTIYTVINVDLYNEQVDCLLEKQYLDVITWDIKNGVLMQSTGLYDKNGTEIFEGDILYHPLQGMRKVYYPFNDRVASYGLENIENGMRSTLQDAHRVYEVVGKCYEHSNLLEK